MGSSFVHGSIADPMFMEAAFFDVVMSSFGSLHVAVAQLMSPLHLQVGTIPASLKALIGFHAASASSMASFSNSASLAVIGSFDWLHMNKSVSSLPSDHVSRSGPSSANCSYQSVPSQSLGVGALVTSSGPSFQDNQCIVRYGISSS
ncbi:hypothetical protein LWI28_018267 [Acer negundo]|uniref:Uncharacterized protein n=1 Tax=Acer negundo TaxID=4023 RepID=A0AAD5NM02_ACENE|nr:hypothetical protein LWI28_018267 [Acer negundo]